jgi:ABC-type uncharacterized transport system permease subunit
VGSRPQTSREVVTWPRRRWRVVKRLEASSLASVAFRVLAVVLALLLAGIAIEASGRSAPALASQALKGTLGSSYGLAQAAVLATPLILTGLSVALCMKMNLWNIGAEGQFYMGAWAAAGIGIFLQGPPALVVVLMVLGGAAAGAAWMVVPALARAWANVSEVITTLLLNFVAILFVNYFAIGPWRDKSVGMAAASYWITPALPTLFGSQVHAGILAAVALAIVLALSLRHTAWGFENTTIGRSRRVAEYAGIPVARRIAVVMLLSGAIAGLAGVAELTGVAHRLSGRISNQYGYLGILVAALASGSPLGVVPVGFLLAVLLNAGIVLQAQGLPLNTVTAITGLILLFAAVGEVASRYRIARVRSPEEGAPLCEPDPAVGAGSTGRVPAGGPAEASAALPQTHDPDIQH